MFSFIDFQLHVNNEKAFGDYVCKATNKLGKVEQVITLLKSSKPAVPEMAIREAKHDSVKLDIEGPENEELGILGYRVQYIGRQELKKGWNSSKVVEFDKGKCLHILPASVCFVWVKGRSLVL
jgi:hypothetical protein